MAANIPHAACDPDIFRDGQLVALLDGTSEEIEKWVRAVADKVNARVDWHYCAGIARMLHRGDAASRDRVETTINELGSSLDGQILQRFPNVVRIEVAPRADGHTYRACFQGDLARWGWGKSLEEAVVDLLTHHSPQLTSEHRDLCTTGVNANHAFRNLISAFLAVGYRVRIEFLTTEIR